MRVNILVTDENGLILNNWTVEGEPHEDAKAIAEGVYEALNMCFEVEDA